MDMKARIVAVYEDTIHLDNKGNTIPGLYQIELKVIFYDGTMEEAKQVADDGVVYRLVPEPPDSEGM